MGGHGSGRKGGRPTVESCLTLNLSHLFKSGALKPGAAISDVLRWTNVRTGQEVASVGFEAQLGTEDGLIRLRWTSTDHRSGEKRQCETSIALTTSLQHFGGRRWYFLCPRTGRRATRLHLPSGADAFATQAAHRLGYRSQCQTPYDRAVCQAFKLRERLGDHNPIGSYVDRPKGMHRRTFERLTARIHRAQAIFVRRVATEIERFDRSLRK